MKQDTQSWSSCLVSSIVNAVGGEAKVRYRCEKPEESGGFDKTAVEIGIEFHISLCLQEMLRIMCINKALNVS